MDCYLYGISLGNHKLLWLIFIISVFAEMGFAINILDLDLFLFYVAFNSQGHIATVSLWLEEPVHTSWSRFCTVNNWASAF